MYTPFTALSPLCPCLPGTGEPVTGHRALGVATSVLSPGEGHLPHPTSSTPECSQRDHLLPLVLAHVQSGIHEDSKVLCRKVAFQMVTFPARTQAVPTIPSSHFWEFLLKQREKWGIICT